MNPPPQQFRMKVRIESFFVGGVPSPRPQSVEPKRNCSGNFMLLILRTAETEDECFEIRLAMAADRTPDVARKIL